MGCIGMSRQDFCHCTPSQFKAIYDSWADTQNRAERLSWEQTRSLCLCMVQPHCKKQLRAEDIMKFPWDAKIKDPDADLTPEERKARYEAAKKRYGITT